MAGIYIHIPFCKRKCIYCDFYSVACRPGSIDDYVAAVTHEAVMRRGELQGLAINTLYIGGGTPSLLSPRQLDALVQGVGNAFQTSDIKEFTIEVNPDDITVPLTRFYHSMGINRVSMGVQSFIDQELLFIHRRHNARQAIEAYNALRESGIGNISIDLIYGIPGQTVQSWQTSLDAAMQLRPEHISCYNLTYEDGTRLTRLLDSGEIAEVPDDDCIAMFQLMNHTLQQHGYEHYEISNYALPGRQSRHNSNYWNRTPYLGLGAAAHSYTGGMRSFNPANVKQYTAAIAAGRTAATVEHETADEMYNEVVMLRLRTSQGLDASTLPEPYHSHFVAQIAPFTTTGIVAQQGSRYHLTQKGIMIADTVIRAVFYP